jgi:hypothetical protein
MGERVLQLRCDWPNTLTAPQRLPQNGIDDQSKAFRMASDEHLNRARRELSWLGGKGRFIGRRRLRGRSAMGTPRFGRRKLPGRTASRKGCTLARVCPGDRERQIS